MGNTDYAKYVNPFIGTIGHLLATTSPNVQSPHGAAVVAPMFTPGMKDIYNADRIYGFRAGEGLIMGAATADCSSYASIGDRFDHDFEEAHPYSYEVFLEDSDIRERHTANKNYGVFQFDYPNGEGYAVVWFPGEGEVCLKDGCIYGGDKFLRTMFVPENADAIEEMELLIPGYRAYEGQLPDRKVKAYRIRFAAKTGTVRFVLSTVGDESCAECYKAEVAGRSFDDVSGECHNAWNKLLGKARVEGGTEDEKTVFYTAIYRATSRMHNYSVLGKYRGMDGEVHDDGGKGYYCDDGIWDTYRGMHPLQLILEPEVEEGTLASYLRMYQQSGWLPRFPRLQGNAPCMIGHHTVSLYADALAKGVPFDLELAYEAAYKNAMKRTMCPWMDGEAEDLTQCYYDKGFFPGIEEDEEETSTHLHEYEDRQSVAVTIEHSYDDWCMAQLAHALGKKDDEEYFLNRSKNYRNVYNKETGFVHPRKIDGEFTREYDPKWCGGQGGRKYFAENNAYIYNFAAQHDTDGMVEMHGGKEAFGAKLDQLYIEQYDGQLKSKFLGQYPDATGLMGQFCMGNEPSFHVPYLYDFCGQAWKTQRKIHEIIRLWFTNSPLGICGDEDGGAMSAFLAFSAMGFYPVCPGSDKYDLGSPIFDKIELDLPNGKTFTVRAAGASGKKKYIRGAAINGKALEEPAFTHAAMMEGGELVLEMDERPNKELWA